jgi:6-pyruvoyltetrahydropterin/6-carboxytetrahydropterin synthase
MKDKMASTEILAMEIWKILEPKISTISKFGTLHAVKLYETPRNYVEYFGVDDQEKS